MKWLWRSLVALALVVGFWLLWERVLVTEETRIRRLIAQMERAVEQGNLLRLEAAIASDYTDEHGLDKSALLALVRTYRQAYESVEIRVQQLQVALEPEGETATADFIATVLAKTSVASGEQEERDAHVRLWLRKTNDAWKMRRAESPDLKWD